MRITRILAILLIAISLTFIACTTPSESTPTPTPDSTPSQTTEPNSEPTTETPSPSEIQAQVIRVIDGDTIEVNIDGQIYKLRYIGIDTPETVHPTRGEEPCGKEASDKNRELVEGKVVRLEKDISETDKYGRLLRYVYVGDIFINAELVKLGYAQVATYPPDVKYQDLFLQLQREAREAGRGCWGFEEETTEPIPTPSPTPSESVNVKITKIFYDGLVKRVESDEYVEIKNLGSESIDLAGWRLVDIDEGYPTFTFLSYILEPGQSVRVYTNEIHPEYGGFSFGSGKAVWNNSSPDTAVLYNAQGQEVSRKSY